MPPRRSCLRKRYLKKKMNKPSFNATTAFLLPIIPQGGGLLSSPDGTSKGMGIVGFEHRSVSTAPSPLPRPSHHRRSAEAFSEPSIICPFRSLEG